MLISFIFGGVWGCGSLLVFILDIYCIIKIAESRREALAKAIWIVLVIVFPLLGAILWLLFAKK